jgi:hypothetical protein
MESAGQGSKEQQKSAGAGAGAGEGGDEDGAARTRGYPLTPGDYRLLEEIGRGPRGAVYSALCLPYNELVAIKVVQLDEGMRISVVLVCSVVAVSREVFERGLWLLLDPFQCVGCVIGGVRLRANASVRGCC